MFKTLVGLPLNATLRYRVQKGLCIAALIISIIVFALFLADLILDLSGMNEIAPFKYADMTIDIVFVVCSLALAVMSWFTLREQV